MSVKYLRRWYKIKTILCIDDIEANLYTIKSVLESQEQSHYNIVLSRSASDGLAILLKQKIDLILLDIMMPEIDGFSAAQMIKSNKKTKDIPIIFVTAKKDDETIEKCYKIGGSDYVNKPFNNIELLSRVAFQLKLKEKEKAIQKEKEYVQNIFDLQDNIIIVSDRKKAIKANRALLEFFQVDILDDFIDKYKCICHTFVKEDGYFHLGLLEDNSKWIEEVFKKIKNDDLFVKIIKDKKEYIFAITVASIYDNFLITLTDVTHFSEASKEFEREANYDNLTQIYNRNMFHRLIDKKIHKYRDTSRVFVFIIFDIDHFKKVNDKHGHLVGDEVLKSLTKLVQRHIRNDDIFARWGGEEFVLIFDVSLEIGMHLANTLRQHIENEKFDTINTLTCSFGVTEFKNDDNLDKMLQRADEALYKAKESGRNRVCQVV